MSLVNPYKKKGPCRTVVVESPAKVQPPRYGAAQHEFMQRTRRATSADPSILCGVDWCRIQQSSSFLSLTATKKISANSFYVKDIAVWLPHIVVPDYTPTCYRCNAKSGVDVGSFRWVENPKILYGLQSHRCLDTVCYKCRTCHGAEFAATREEVLRIDAAEITADLNFRLSPGFGVDEDLYSFIVCHSTDTTALCYQRIKDLHADRWVNYATLCHRAILANRTKPALRVQNAGTLTTQRENADQKKRRSLQFEHTSLQRLVSAKQTAFDGDINFLNICRRKENRNSTGEIFPGIGKAKCKTLSSRGIHTAKQLIAHDGDDPSIKYSWQAIVQKHYDTLESELGYLKAKCDNALTELQLHMSIFGDLTAAPTVNVPANVPANNEKPPQFSQLCDPVGYDCRVVSKQTINRIHMSDFQRRRALQQAKMRCIKCRAWIIDWHYKISSKIKVHTTRGNCFSPYKSALTIQNEDALTVFWKFYEGTESIETARKDLVLLKRRKELLCADDPQHDGELNACWVDNCCIVRPKLKSVLGPNVEVKLDVFHWQERWNEMLYDKNSEKTAIFRKLMRQALFCTEDHEIALVEALLFEKKKKKPTAYEIFKEAKATIPPPDQLERRVMSVVQALLEKDLQADRNVIAGSDAPATRFFKRGANTLNTIINQMSHVKNGCLSDPPDTAIPIFRVNPKTKKAFTARSAGTCEVDNRYLNRLLDTPSVGLTRADRLTHNYYEQSNDNKMVNRMGINASETSRTEQLGMLHALAGKCGFHGFPSKEVQYPSNIDVLDEKIGFDYHLPEVISEARNAEEDGEGDDPDGDEDLVVFLNDVDLSLPGTGETNPMDLDDDDLQPIDVFGNESSVDISICVATVVENEKTCDTFIRKTQEAPWVPFAHPKDAATFSALDKAEHQLFNEMAPSYSRDSRRLDGPAGYKTFSKAWDLQVANLYRASIDGDADVQRINRKSYVQLQDHSDILKKQKETLAESMANDPHILEVERVFRTTRREMQQQPHQSTAPNLSQMLYQQQLGRPQFGVPLALNTPIVAGAFQQSTGMGPPTTFRSPRPAVTVVSKTALGKLFRFNKHCWRCGFQKRAHVRSGMPFGDKCIGNCGYEQCSKCNQRIFDCHSIGLVGPHCPLEATERTPDWWKEDEEKSGVI